jgi:hypothetical protein|tara:strand:+ start:1848 stop:2333 length:486 start_codon:yes stop_codon:yes gene_type:complete
MNTININLPESVTFRCSQSGESRELELATLAPEYIAQIIGSCQVATDAMALGKDATREEKVRAWNVAFARLQSGDHKFGAGGGRNLSVEERATREVIEKIATENGAKSVDAKALAKTPMATIRNWAEASDTTITALMEVIQPQIDALIEVKSTKLNVTITL